MKYPNSIGDMATEEELQYGISTGMAYRNQYWILSEHMFKQEGVFGQRVAVFPKIGLVIAMFGSQPTEGDQYFDHMNMVFEMAAEYANVTVTYAAAVAAADDGAVDKGNLKTEKKRVCVCVCHLFECQYDLV
jgi:CubicO group peptidase (beta-lactamase class C family)